MIYSGPIIYSVSILILFIFIMTTILRTLRKATDRRERRLNKQEGISSVSRPTKTMRKKMKETKLQGIDNIEKQFTITRKILVPFFIFLALIVAIIPFLNSAPAALLSLVAAVLSIVVGMAAKPFLENLFAGLVISYSHSLNIGDTVLINDHYGTVEDINLSYSIIKTWDWKRYIIPNNNMMRQDFLNYTLIEKYQWVYIEFSVAYDNDLSEVEKIALDCAYLSEFTLEDNTPYFWIMEMEKESYKCWLVSWAENPSKAWSLKNDLRTRLIKAFQENRIEVHSFRYVLDRKRPSSTRKPEEETPLEN